MVLASLELSTALGRRLPQQVWLEWFRAERSNRGLVRELVAFHLPEWAAQVRCTRSEPGTARYLTPASCGCSISTDVRVSGEDRGMASERTERQGFDPSKFLTKVNGNDYLEVKWRLLWFRTDHPDGEIETELVEHRDGVAVFRARVKVPGGGSATGWGSESAEDFADYLEKAETKALGRALAALGYGTQFCPDFEFGAVEQRVVDAPVDAARLSGRRALGGRATPRQLEYLRDMARRLGMTEEELEAQAREQFGAGLEELARQDASALIETLRQRRSAHEAA